jgi:hypothetical protein
MLLPYDGGAATARAISSVIAAVARSTNSRNHLRSLSRFLDVVTNRTSVVILGSSHVCYLDRDLIVDRHVDSLQQACLIVAEHGAYILSTWTVPCAVEFLLHFTLSRNVLTALPMIA